MPKTFAPYYVNVSAQRKCLWVGSSDFSHDGQKTENFLIPWSADLTYETPTSNGRHVLKPEELWDIIHSVADGEDVTANISKSNFGNGDRVLIHGVEIIHFDVSSKGRQYVTIFFQNGNFLTFSAGKIHRHYEFLPNFGYNLFRDVGYHTTLV